jgi:hypothetical protein
VKDQYIVVLPDYVAEPSLVASELAALYGGKVRQTWSAALKGFSVEMSEGAATRLTADARVAHVEPVVEMGLADTQGRRALGP